VIRYGSSFRQVPVEETLRRARGIAKSVGISRVTEVTYLDRIGIPVFVAIRPDAQPRSVCVSAGKGLTAADARIGAYMEAIELAWAEHVRARVPIVTARARDLLDGAQRPRAVLDFAPTWGTILDLDAPMLCVEAADIEGDARFLVPAEAVLHPLPDSFGGMRYFGTGSNGLASGNSVEEATVHGLAEVIERDITSFHNVRDGARLVRPETLPEVVRDLRQRIDAAGFELVVRYLPNPFGLPAFMAVSFDRNQPEITLRGDGCHPSKEVALLRAVTETIQCRLSLIHGGRDDLDVVYRPVAPLPQEERASLYKRVLTRLSQDPAPLDYADIADRSDGVRDLSSCLARLLSPLREAGISRVLRVVYTPNDYPVQVVRVIVPGLECYSRDTRRIGPRLRRFIDQPSQKSDPVQT